MPKKRTRVIVQDLVAERIHIREPGGGRTRALLECFQTEGHEPVPPIFGVRLPFLDLLGRPRLVIDVDPEGDASMTVGNPGPGATTVVTSAGLDVWGEGGNVVAALAGGGNGEILDLRRPDGRTVVRLPEA